MDYVYEVTTTLLPDSLALPNSKGSDAKSQKGKHTKYTNHQ